MTTTKYARLEPKDRSGQTSEQRHKCRVANCTHKFVENYKGLGRHYRTPRHHSVEELLDAGVSAWFYRKEREDDCRAIIGWLYKNNYIAIGEVVEEEEELQTENNGVNKKK